MRVLIHAHSNFSYDGADSPAALAAWGAARGLDAILLSEHVNDFDQAKMERYSAAVDACRGSGCTIVPGLEFAARGGFHILGLHLTEWRHLVEPFEIVRFIRDSGGIAVLAHPRRYAGAWPDDRTLAQLDGVEGWNARYEGRFFPSGQMLRSCRAVADRIGRLRLFGGQDLHAITANRLIVTEVDDEQDISGLIGALRTGRFRFGAPGFSFDALAGVGVLRGGLLETGHRIYRAARGMRDRVAR